MELVFKVPTVDVSGQTRPLQNDHMVTSFAYTKEWWPWEYWICWITGH